MDQLPDEVITNILIYLCTKDILQFLNAFDEYSYFLRVKRVIQVFNLKNMFELNTLNVCRFISSNVEYVYIKVLNINCLYWIQVQDLRKLLSKLEMLEELYASDTKLGVRAKDIFLYGKLKKLSITVEVNQLEDGNSNFYFNCLYSLERLCLKLSLKKESFEELYYFLGALRRLTELWIYDCDEQYGINYERIVANLPQLNKLVIKSKRPVPILDFSCWGLAKIFQNTRYEFAVETMFEKISVIDEGEFIISCPKAPIEKALQVFKSLHCEMPWGPRDFEVLNCKTFFRRCVI